MLREQFDNDNDLLTHELQEFNQTTMDLFNLIREIKTEQDPSYASDFDSEIDQAEDLMTEALNDKEKKIFELYTELKKNITEYIK